LSEEERAKQQYLINNLNRKLNVNFTNFKYLDVFEQQAREQKKAMDEFYNEMKQEEQDLEQNKPAMFRKQSSDTPSTHLIEKEEAHENMRKLFQQEIDFDTEDKSMEELREFFKVSQD